MPVATPQHTKQVLTRHEPSRTSSQWWPLQPLPHHLANPRSPDRIPLHHWPLHPSRHVTGRSIRAATPVLPIPDCQRNGRSCALLHQWPLHPPRYSAGQRTILRNMYIVFPPPRVPHRTAVLQNGEQCCGMWCIYTMLYCQVCS